MGSLKLDDGMNQCSIYFDDQHEESFVATATHNHWVHYTSGPERQSENFSEYTEGNAVKAFLGGKEYFAALLAAFKQAKSSIYITGWQVNWDAQLAEGIRLVDALMEAAQESSVVKIYIMPWDNPALIIETYAAATERVFAAMNTHLGRQAFYVQCAGQQSGVFFSHHQKCVIVDENIAFVGGIDLAYGRYDDNYGLQANAEGRQGMNMYNPCIPPMVHSKGYDPMDEYVVPDSEYSRKQHQDTLKKAEQRQADSVQRIIDSVLKHGVWQSQGSSKESLYLNPQIQPRMPWQDYQVQIEGPAVDDLIKNFVLRWNSYSHRYPHNPLQTQIPELEMHATRSAKKGSCQVQVLRSAALKMRLAEYQKTPDVAPKARLKQNDILHSLHLLISKAENYIYFENQFFVSAFGESSIGENVPLSPVAKSINPSLKAWASRILPDDEIPQNLVAKWLGDRIKRAIFSHMETPFHVYIVLPVYPEGRLDDPSIVAQIHLTRQSLVFGSHSLLNRIRRSLWVRQQLETQAIPRKEWSTKIEELEKQCDMKYTSIPLNACDKYVTLLNLRDHAELNGKAVTEQIYVHSKLTIVDDRYVLVGSANINDRSLQGDRDSELAVLISDTEHGYTDLDGSGNAVPYRHFARELRQKAWRKWLGSAAGECAEALDKPASPTSWEKIQALARANADAYGKVFNYIPKDYINQGIQPSGKPHSVSGITSTATEEIISSIWPVIKSNTMINNCEFKMPFSEAFWKDYNFVDRGSLNVVKGYFTSLPTKWSEGENNLLPYNMRLIASNSTLYKDMQLLSGNNDKNKSQGGQA
ncbi:phospholipase D-like domain-containing protein [Leclercia sp. S52]|uniref:phospholipase D-like domain-containing protein n=1 Tax=Leclercia sp. S52 TaxID=3138178 RepID=UPI00321A6A8C